jgi:hypothetical protein
MIQFLIQIVAQRNGLMVAVLKIFLWVYPKADDLLRKRMGRYISGGTSVFVDFQAMASGRQW